MWKIGIPNPMASTAPETRGFLFNPPTSLLLTCGLLKGRVASPLWVNGSGRTWPPSQSSMSSLFLLSGADMVIWKSGLLRRDLKHAVKSQQHKYSLSRHSDPPAVVSLSHLYHVGCFSVFYPKQGHSPFEHYITPNEEIILVSTL